MDVKYVPQEVESDILDFWAGKKIFKKLRKLLSKSDKKFSFQDGPITANNPMGVHHAWGRTYKDVFQRFWAMRGYNQRWQNGFDCQGLWVEREEERDRGFKSKGDIENFGLENWSNACRDRVKKFIKLITEDSIRLGMWMDWGSDYLTMSDDNTIHNWHLLKKYHENKWLYKGKDAVPWCSRCGTASSKHDIITEGYREVTHTALYMKFPIVGKLDEYLLIFTTTPWTVPANVAVAVNPNIFYIKIKIGREFYWLAESRASEVTSSYEIVDKLVGSDLAGIKYGAPYSKLPALANAPHIVVTWDMASGEEGTGIVHIAPGCGPEDYDLGEEERLPAISPLDEAGRFEGNWGWLSGMHVSEANPKIVEDMQKREFVYKTEPYTHRYPHCWRCGTELVFRLVDEWYIRCNEIRQKLIDANRKVRWRPDYGKQRQDDWFSNMDDWLISRKRYWGLPLPIWECGCGHVEVIGGLEELKEKVVSGMHQLKELHRPWIDKVKIKCLKCGKEASRISDVGDAWLDAGIVPFSTIGPYLKNKAYWKQWFPPDFVSENLPGQYRGWFNALFWASVTLSGKAPFKSMFGYETLKDEKGEEMHKSKGNAVEAREALERLGADPLRWRFCIQDPSAELRFGWSTCDEAKRTLTVLWNLGKYLSVNLDKNFTPKAPKPKTTVDRWTLSRLETVKKNVTEYLEDLQPHRALQELQNFILEDFSRGYIHFVRDRMNTEDKGDITFILYKVLLEINQLAAPFIPFITEKNYQDIFRKYEKIESIHLFHYPEVNKNLIDSKLEEDVYLIRELISGILAAREKIKRSVRWPIKRVAVISANKKITEVVKDYEELVTGVTNVLEISAPKEIPESRRDIRVDFKKLELKFGKDAAEILAKLTILSPDALMKSLKKTGLYTVKYRDKEVGITGEEVAIEPKLPANIILHEMPKCKLYIYIGETEDMLASGFVREVVRAVQALRKKAGLQKQELISLMISADKEIEDALKQKLSEIRFVVGAGTIKFGSVSDLKTRDKIKIRGKDILFGW